MEESNSLRQLEIIFDEITVNKRALEAFPKPYLTNYNARQGFLKGVQWALDVINQKRSVTDALDSNAKWRNG